MVMAMRERRITGAICVSGGCSQTDAKQVYPTKFSRTTSRPIQSFTYLVSPHITSYQTMSSNSRNPVPPGYNGAPPKYLNDFTKTLASEVRVLLDEVGKLREERQQLQLYVIGVKGYHNILTLYTFSEIAELMAVKSKHGGGFPAQWPKDAPPALEAPPLPDAPAEPPAPARPAWRVVHKREKKERPPKNRQGAISPPPMSPSPALMEPARPNLPAWAQWRPNPMHSPVLPIASPSPGPPPTVESRRGIFGPPTPPPK
ncbi:hypothetical protein D9758_007626 [Tetrapyrgos nigripes]|uniref:Uncharacterized protein n=1 Tax=Tetrapyrgos nigripes TaxID=182062 RepID=A0A8H5G7Z4_9AGAR|nr:hypothetical protein D9758_007626 [Tetrapyrgos nigripes]